MVPLLKIISNEKTQCPLTGECVLQILKNKTQRNNAVFPYTISRNLRCLYRNNSFAHVMILMNPKNIMLKKISNVSFV